MGKSTTSTGPFSIAMLVYQRVYITGWWFQPLWKIWKSLGMIIPNIWNNGSNQPHPDLRSSSFGQGQWPEAEELYRQALQGRRLLLGTSGRWQHCCWSDQYLLSENPAKSLGIIPGADWKTHKSHIFSCCIPSGNLTLLLKMAHRNSWFAY